MEDIIPCDICKENDLPEDKDNPATYALSLSESNSASNINFVCPTHMKGQLDFMLSFGLGSVDVQSMVEVRVS